MTRSKPHYSPWERTEAEDDQITTALDKASDEQMAGFVDDLILLAQTPPQEETEKS